MGPEPCAAPATGRVDDARRSEPTSHRATGVRREGVLLSLDAVTSLVQAIFGVSLTLASCARVVDRPAAAKLLGAIDDLDAIIHDLQRATIERLSDEGRPPPTAPPPEPVGLRAALDLLDRAAAATARLASDDADEPETVQILDAVHSISRAIVAVRNGRRPRG